MTERLRGSCGGQALISGKKFSWCKPVAFAVSSGFRLRTPASAAPRSCPQSGSKQILRAKTALRISPEGSRSACAPHSRLQSGSKCNEALSRDLWPLDPFESAPMRATSSGMCYCIPCAIEWILEIKELAELLSGKARSNSLLLKKLLCGFF